MSRLRSASTRTTFVFACSAVTPAWAPPDGNVIECMKSGGIEPVSVAPAAVISADCAASAVPSAKVTMYGTAGPVNASRMLTDAVAPSAPVAVALNVYANPKGSANDAAIDPSAAAITSAS